MNKKLKLIIFLLFFSLFLGNLSNAEILKIGKLEIELFDKDKLIKSSGSIDEGFGKAKIRIYAEKTDNNQIKSIVTTVQYKGMKYGAYMKNWWIDYFFKQKKTALFYENEINNFNLYDSGFTNGLVIKEFDLIKYLNKQDDFVEFKRAIKKLKKKHNVQLPERVIKSDHVYLKGGDLIWVGHMFNYNVILNENIFIDKITKFHPNIIEDYPNINKKMNSWINLSLKRHQEFQNKLNIRTKIDLTYEDFDPSNDLSHFKNNFNNLISNFEITQDKTNITPEEKAKIAAEQKAKEEKEKKAKIAAEQKAKEEKEKKAKIAAEQKAKEEKEKKAKIAAEQKAKEEKENKAKIAAEQKAKEEKENKAKIAAEQKAKEEKEKAKKEKAKKPNEDKSKSQEELSVEELMSKIKELNEMYKSGLISKEEFELLKSKLLNKN